MLKDRLKTLRTVAGLSQAELSTLAGLNRSHVGLIEQGRIDSLSASSAAGLAQALGSSLDWLVLGSGEGPTDSEVTAAVAAARVAAAERANAEVA